MGKNGIDYEVKAYWLFNLNIYIVTSFSMYELDIKNYKSIKKGLTKLPTFFEGIHVLKKLISWATPGTAAANIMI